MPGTLEELPATIEAAREALLKAQERQAFAYNAKRKQVSLAPGDFALVHHATLSPELNISAKYRPQFIGPFEVMEAKPNDNYKLKLPAHLRVHPEFHISALRPYRAPEDGRVIHRPGPVAGGDEFEVDEVLAERKRRGRRQFLVQWKGYDQAEATWEPEENLTNAQGALAAFRQAHT